MPSPNTAMAKPFGSIVGPVLRALPPTYRPGSHSAPLPDDEEVARSQTARRNPHRDESDIYKAYLTIHARYVAELAWMLRTHATSEERAAYDRITTLRSTASSEDERHRLGEELKLIEASVRGRITVAEARADCDRHAEEIAEHHDRSIKQREVTLAVFRRLAIPLASVGIDAGTGETTLRFWCAPSEKTECAADQFVRALRAETRRLGLGVRKVRLRYIVRESVGSSTPIRIV